jgi:hypothetical protein
MEEAIIFRILVNPLLFRRTLYTCLGVELGQYRAGDGMVQMVLSSLVSDL